MQFHDCESRIFQASICTGVIFSFCHDYCFPRTDVRRNRDGAHIFLLSQVLFNYCCDLITRI